MAVPTPGNMTTAVSNMITAYNAVARRTSPDFSELGTGNIGGKTLVPGLYKWTNTLIMPTDVINAGGPNDVWIFQVSGNLTMGSAIKIILSGGAQAENISGRWQARRPSARQRISNAFFYLRLGLRCRLEHPSTGGHLHRQLLFWTQMQSPILNIK